MAKDRPLTQALFAYFDCTLLDVVVDCVNPSEVCSADGPTHTESNKLYRKVKHRYRPNLSPRQRPTAKARHDQAALAASAEARGATHRARPRSRPTEKFVQKNVTTKLAHVHAQSESTYGAYLIAAGHLSPETTSLYIGALRLLRLHVTGRWHRPPVPQHHHRFAHLCSDGDIPYRTRLGCFWAAASPL